MNLCFIHTFMRLNCDLCGLATAYRVTVYGQATMLRTQFGWLFMDAGQLT